MTSYELTNVRLYGDIIMLEGIGDLTMSSPIQASNVALTIPDMNGIAGDMIVSTTTQTMSNKTIVGITIDDSLTMTDAGSTFVFNLIDNSATAASFDAPGATGLLLFDTTNSAELLQLGGELNMTSNKITNLAAPIANTDAVTKLYVDSLAAGVDAKLESYSASYIHLSAIYEAVASDGLGVGATLTATSNGVLYLDGWVTTTGDRVLIKAQNQAETTHFKFSAGLTGQYWLVNSSTTSYYVWYRFNDAAADPAPGGTGILVTTTQTTPTMTELVSQTQPILNAYSTGNVFNCAIDPDDPTSLLVSNCVTGVTTDVGYGTMSYIRTKIYDGSADNTSGSTHNGIYTVTYQGDISSPFILTRASDHDGSPSYEVSGGNYTLVEFGDNPNKGFILLDALPSSIKVGDAFIVGYANQSYTVFSSTGSYTASEGINLSANVFTLDLSTLTTITTIATPASSYFGVEVAAGNRNITWSNLMTQITTTGILDSLTVSTTGVISINSGASNINLITNGIANINNTTNSTIVIGGGTSGGYYTNLYLGSRQVNSFTTIYGGTNSIKLDSASLIQLALNGTIYGNFSSGRLNINAFDTYTGTTLLLGDSSATSVSIGATDAYTRVLCNVVDKNILTNNSLQVAGGLYMSNTTNPVIIYNTATVGPPTIAAGSGDTSNGTRMLFSPIATGWNMTIGINTNSMWFSLPSAASFDFYHDGTASARITTNRILTGILDTLTGSVLEIGIARATYVTLGAAAALTSVLCNVVNKNVLTNNSLQTAGGLYLSNATNPVIIYNTATLGPPTIAAGSGDTSNGTRMLFYPIATGWNYAMGIDSNTLWWSMGSGRTYKFYHDGVISAQIFENEVRSNSFDSYSAGVLALGSAVATSVSIGATDAYTRVLCNVVDKNILTNNSLQVAGGLYMSNTTNPVIAFNQATLAAPTIAAGSGDTSNGTRMLFSPIATGWNAAIGVNTNVMWFSLPSSDSFDFYHDGTASVRFTTTRILTKTLDTLTGSVLEIGIARATYVTLGAAAALTSVLCNVVNKNVLTNNSLQTAGGLYLSNATNPVIIYNTATLGPPTIAAGSGDTSNGTRILFWPIATGWGASIGIDANTMWFSLSSSDAFSFYHGGGISARIINDEVSCNSFDALTAITLAIGSSTATSVSLGATDASTSVLSTTAATSAFTGALTVAGGLGVAGRIYSDEFISTPDIATDILRSKTGLSPININSKITWSMFSAGDNLFKITNTSTTTPANFRNYAINTYSDAIVYGLYIQSRNDDESYKSNIIRFTDNEIMTYKILIIGTGGIKIQSSVSTVVGGVYYGMLNFEHPNNFTYEWFITMNNDTPSNSNAPLGFVFWGTGSAVLVGYLATTVYIADIDFTGQHRNIPDDPNILTNINNYKGFIVSSTGVVNSPGTGSDGQPGLRGAEGIDVNDTLPIVTLSSAANDKKVYGVISNGEDTGSTSRDYRTGVFVTVTESNDTRLFVNAVGEGGIVVCNINGNVENGDLITSTEIPGLGGVQMESDGITKDDLFHSYTVAKAVMDCSFDLASTNYNCTSFVHNGTTYKRAMIGCTYHCG